jgi:cytochrome c2
MGPTLWNVVGRRSGAVAGYRYSDAGRDPKIVWTPQTLREHLIAPANLIHATRTKFPGMADQEQLDDVIAYLQTLN